MDRRAGAAGNERATVRKRSARAVLWHAGGERGGVTVIHCVAKPHSQSGGKAPDK